MNVICNGRNLCIVNKKTETFNRVFIEEGVLYVSNEQTAIGEIYACLYCEELKNITIVVRGKEIFKIALIFENIDNFEEVLKMLKTNLTSVEISTQNIKINGYAQALVEKLQEGIAVTIIDTKEDKSIMYCPDCGVQCDPNIPYCMECGASL